MDKTTLLHEAQQRLSELLRSSPAADIERNIKALMTQTFQRMDLITRDEFDLFEARLEHLQARVLELESRLSPRPASDTSNASSASAPSA
jgi:BMFP domain-containing protein YqiC